MADDYPATDQPSTDTAVTPDHAVAPDIEAAADTPPVGQGKSAADYNVYLGPFVFTPRGSLILILIISVGINLLLVLIIALVALIKAGKL